MKLFNIRMSNNVANLCACLCFSDSFTTEVYNITCENNFATVGSFLGSLSRSNITVVDSLIRNNAGYESVLKSLNNPEPFVILFKNCQFIENKAKEKQFELITSILRV